MAAHDRIRLTGRLREGPREGPFLLGGRDAAGREGRRGAGGTPRGGRDAAGREGRRGAGGTPRGGRDAAGRKGAARGRGPPAGRQTGLVADFEYPNPRICGTVATYGFGLTRTRRKDHHQGPDVIRNPQEAGSR